jgi:hypothetical protein
MTRVYTLILLTILSFNTVYSQQDNTLFFMHELPQANFVNPAVSSTCKLFIGMPALSSIAANYSNTAFTVRDVLTTRNGSNLLYFNPDKIVSKARGKELITSDIDVTLLTMGLHVNKYYLTFSVNEKARTYNMITADAMQLGWQGNTQFRGRQATADGIRINGNGYHEFAFGASKTIKPKWRVGLRAKILFGLANVYTSKTNGYLFTDNNTYNLNFFIDSKINTSLPIEQVITDKDGKVTDLVFREDYKAKDLLFNFRNFGLGVDLGFIHPFNENTILSGSLLDIGTIFWKKDINKFQTNGSMTYSGLGPNSGFTSFEQLTDSLINIVTPYHDTISTSFSSPLVPKLYIGVTHKIHDHINAGVLIRTELYRNRLHPSLTISANTINYKILSASVSYTLQNGEFTNIGAGVGVKAGPVQLHLISDNIPGLFMLDNTRNVNIRFGLSFVPRCNKRFDPFSFSEEGAIPCNFDYKPKYKTVPSQKNKKRRKL